MNDWERFGDWLATIAVASLAWVSGLAAPDVPAAIPEVTGASAPVANQPISIMSWAQAEDEPPIEQVGEETGEDVETLDEAAPPVEEPEEVASGEATEDIELLDQGPPVGVQEDDVELLDQGSPPATAGPAPATAGAAPATVTTVPVTTSEAPNAASGPFLPQGFGTGNVHVATGSAGFPIGLEECHVGAVTGRAYVGIDCGEESETSFVGHAPSFEEFPFVLVDNFPFDRESVFADRGESQLESEVETLISAARGAPFDVEETAPEIRTSGTSSVEFEQRARDRKPRIEADDGRSRRSKKVSRSDDIDQTASQAQDENDRASAQSEQKAKKKGKRGGRGDSKADDRKKADEKKTKRSRDSKKHDDKKGKKNPNRN